MSEQPHPIPEQQVSLCQAAKILVGIFSRPGVADHAKRIAEVIDALHAIAHANRAALVQLRFNANLETLPDRQFRQAARAILDSILADDQLDGCTTAILENHP